MHLKRIPIALALLLAAASPPPASAQPADAATTQRILDALAGQRNRALNEEVNATVRAAGLTEELAKAQARIREMEAAARPRAAAPEPPQ